ncbi:uncharacterized protein LOC124172643 [Ischnura elegans]|uniref:uncharacterized protein LOC124172643 n=1 Tax=Ischnura elegans TaxID=197161 RepID=UPI001ED88FFE|nr:uncharacterized protein LOC124172643 [Ischnura elegans]XP_046408046.1 uncharacterized protein LOC124172643 [Ischnura elegans]
MNQVFEPDGKIETNAESQCLEASTLATVPASLTVSGAQKPETSRGSMNQVSEPTRIHGSDDGAGRLCGDSTEEKRFASHGCIEDEMFMAVKSKSVDDCEDLFDKIADINAIGENGATLLQFAVEMGRLDWTEKLLSMGSDPNLCDKPGLTVLSSAEDLCREFPGDSERKIILRLVKFASRFGCKGRVASDAHLGSESSNSLSDRDEGKRVVYIDDMGTRDGLDGGIIGTTCAEEINKGEGEADMKISSVDCEVDAGVKCGSDAAHILSKRGQCEETSIVLGDTARGRYVDEEIDGCVGVKNENEVAFGGGNVTKSVENVFTDVSGGPDNFGDENGSTSGPFNRLESSVSADDGTSSVSSGGASRVSVRENVISFLNRSLKLQPVEVGEIAVSRIGTSPGHSRNSNMIPGQTDSPGACSINCDATCAKEEIYVGPPLDARHVFLKTRGGNQSDALAKELAVGGSDVGAEASGRIGSDGAGGRNGSDVATGTRGENGSKDCEGGKSRGRNGSEIVVNELSGKGCDAGAEVRGGNESDVVATEARRKNGCFVAREEARGVNMSDDIVGPQRDDIHAFTDESGVNSCHEVCETLTHEVECYKSTVEERMDKLKSIIVELSQKVDFLSLQSALLKEDTRTLIDSAAIRGTTVSDIRTEVASMKREFLSKLEEAESSSMVGNNARKVKAAKGTSFTVFKEIAPADTVHNMRGHSISSSFAEDVGSSKSGIGNVAHESDPSSEFGSCRIEESATDVSARESLDEMGHKDAVYRTQGSTVSSEEKYQRIPEPETTVEECLVAVEAAAVNIPNLSGSDVFRGWVGEPAANSVDFEPVHQKEEVYTEILDVKEVLMRHLQAMADCFGESVNVEKMVKAYPGLSSLGPINHTPRKRAVDSAVPAVNPKARAQCVNALLRVSSCLGPQNSLDTLATYYNVIYDQGRLASAMMEFLRLHRSGGLAIKADFKNRHVLRMKPIFSNLDGKKAVGKVNKVHVDFSVRTVYVGAKTRGVYTKDHVIAWIAIALTRLSIFLAFGNGGKPYHEWDRDSEEKFGRIVEEAKLYLTWDGPDNVDEYILGALGWEKQESKEVALISAVPGIIAHHGVVEGLRILREQVPTLLYYYEQHVVTRFELGLVNL